MSLCDAIDTVSITWLCREMQLCRVSSLSMSWMKHQRLHSQLSPAPLSQLPLGTLFSLGEENRFTLWKSAVQSNVVLHQDRLFICLLLAMFWVLCWGLGSVPTDSAGSWLLFHQVLSGIRPIDPQHLKAGCGVWTRQWGCFLLMKRNRYLSRDLHPILRYMSKQLWWTALSEVFSVQPQIVKGAE